MIDPIKIIEKYYPKDSDIYFILLIHSEIVKEKALSIAYRKPKLKLDVEFIAQASMLHDIGIFKCNAPLLQCRGTHQYIEHGYLGADILRAEGLHLHALVAERHTGVGLTKQMIIENNLPLPQRDMIPLSLEEQVICYADKFYSKSKLTDAHTVQKIRKDLSQFGESQVAVFDKWHSRFE